MWPWDKISQQLSVITLKLDWLIRREIKEMATLQDIQNAVAAETNTVSAVTTLLQSLAQQLKDAIAAEDPVALQAVVDQINTNANALANAVAANTPGQGTSGVTPTPPAPAPAAPAA